MQNASQSTLLLNVSSEQRALRDLIKQIRKLRWIGMEDGLGWKKKQRGCRRRFCGNESDATALPCRQGTG